MEALKNLRITIKERFKRSYEILKNSKSKN